MTKKLPISVLGCFLIFTTPADGWAGEIIVTITGAKSDTGQVGCGLFNDPDAFPMKDPNIPHPWQTPVEGKVVCRFTNLEPGEYAVSSSHDMNGNQKTDTNFLGIPKEAWGVSNNVRPKLRAPKFKEAKFTLPEDQVLEINIELDK